MNKRTVTMTVYAIEAEQVVATRFGDTTQRYMNGYVTIKAQAEGHHHVWQLTDHNERWWPGDTVDVTIDVPDSPTVRPTPPPPGRTSPAVPIGVEFSPAWPHRKKKRIEAASEVVGNETHAPHDHA